MNRVRRSACLYGQSRSQKKLNLFAPSGTPDYAVERFSSLITRVYRHVGSGRYDVTGWEDKHIPTGGDYHFKAIRGNEWRQAVAPINSEDTAVVRTTGWSIKSTDQTTAYGGSYRSTTTSGSAMTWRSPAYVKLAVLLFVGTLGGIIKVSIDGDATAATYLPTAQNLVDAGQLSSSALVANGGTLNPTDRVFDCYSSGTNNYGHKVLLATGLAAVGHTVKVTYTGYSNPASTATQKVAISGFAGAPSASTRMSDTTAVAAASGTDQDDASVARAGTWLGVTVQATAFSGDYRKTNDYTTPASMTFTTPACTRAEVFAGTGQAMSISRVAIDGDYSRATFLSTVQDFINAGTLPAACLSGVAARSLGSGAMTAGSAVLTTATGWASSDVGRFVTVPGAAAAGGILYALVASYQSATQVTLNTAATTTVTGKTVTAPAGTFSATDRVIDHWSSGSNNFGTNYALAGDLANTTHAVKVELTPYTNPAATVFQPTLYISGFVAGSSFAVGNPVGAWEADLSPGSVHEYAISATLSGVGHFVGNAHGWDEDTSWAVAVDGTPVTLTTDGQIVTGTQGVVVTRNSKLHHSTLASSTALGTVVTTYTIGSTGMTVDHAITWAQNGSAGTAYACMYSGYHAAFDTASTVTIGTDVSLPGTVQVSYGIANSDTLYTWGSTFAAIMRVNNVAGTVRPGVHTQDGYSFIQDRDDPSSFKLYAARIRTGDTEAFAIGDVWSGSAFYVHQKFTDARATLARA